MVHINDKEAVLDHAEKALSGIEPFPIEHRIIHRDGTLRWVRNSIVLSKDEEGNVLYYDGLINNITDRKRAEHQADLKTAAINSGRQNGCAWNNGIRYST